MHRAPDPLPLPNWNWTELQLKLASWVQYRTRLPSRRLGFAHVPVAHQASAPLLVALGAEYGISQCQVQSPMEGHKHAIESRVRQSLELPTTFSPGSGDGPVRCLRPPDAAECRQTPPKPRFSLLLQRCQPQVPRRRWPPISVTPGFSDSRCIDTQPCHALEGLDGDCRLTPTPAWGRGGLPRCHPTPPCSPLPTLADSGHDTSGSRLRHHLPPHCSLATIDPKSL
jgi:hypothetical protein